MRFLTLFAAVALTAQELPQAAPWSLEGDPAKNMIAGMERYLERLRGDLAGDKSPSSEALRYMLGVVDPRANTAAIEHMKTLARGVYAARWAVLEHVTAEGVHVLPVGTRRGCAVVLADADVAPEQFQPVYDLAAAGYEVLAPVLIDTRTEFSGNPAVKMSGLPHREWIYRMSFPVGRHPLGYDVQTALAAVEIFVRAVCGTSILGVGEGGRAALFAAMLEPRIVAVEVENASFEPASLRDQPVYRNIFGLLRFYSDAQVRAALGSRLRRLDRRSTARPALVEIDARERMRRYVKQIEGDVQRLVRESRRRRDTLWSAIKADSPDEWRRGAEPLARRLLSEVIGEVPPERVPLGLRARPIDGGAKWRAWEIQFDVRPEFFGYGVLLAPVGLKPGERRPLVVVQHGLDGTPQVFFHQTSGRNRDIYRNFGALLAELGFIVYMPQNPYTGDFRHLAKMANPLGLSLYSLIRAQYDVMLDWLVTLPFVDASRIGFYGLSYGGKTALRIPPFDTRYRAMVCGGDFNEWIVKLTTPDEPWSYVYTVEYEILEWNLAHLANHAELAMLMVPRPVLIERGHRDGVGIDEWVSYEYARVRRLYDELGIGDRTDIAFFNGPHRVDGPAAVEFLRRHLRH